MIELLLLLLFIGVTFFIGEAILEFVLPLVAYGLGRALLPIVTLGHLRAEAMEDGMTFPWYGLARAGDRELVLSIDGTAGPGLLSLAAAAIGIYVACS